MTYDPEDILAFWFSERVKPLWFNSTPDFDEEIRERYQDVYTAALNGELSHWQDTAPGSVALVIVLDQFPLNMFRGKAASFAGEQLAREVAHHAVNQGYDAQLEDQQKAFLYMPFMHSEDLADQDLSVQLFDKAGLTDNLRFAKHHRGIIQRFGRFPHRNAPLGRQSTDAEMAYLNSEEAFHG
ncbi:MAG: DUF924 family protein [Gammaproteobacteria bacterium]|jgi:uncharacterized protein (DUF924 family)